MSEQVSRIAELEKQKLMFQSKIETCTNEQQIQAFEAEIDRVDAKIAKLKEQTVQVEADIQTAQTAVMNEFERIEIEGNVYSLRDFTINEMFAQVLSEWIQVKVGEVAQQYSAQAQSYKQENEHLIDLMDERDNTISQLRQENDRLDLIGADLQARLDASATRTFEAEEDNRRMMAEIKKLRESTAPKQTAATNTSGKLGDLMQAALNSRPAIYNYVNHGFNKNTAILLSTGEEIQFVDIDKGKYRIVSDEEAKQFRIEQAVAKENEPVPAVSVPDISLVDTVEPPPFLDDEDTDMVDAMEGQPTNGAVQAEAGSVEERLADLERRVSFLEILEHKPAV